MREEEEEKKRIRSGKKVFVGGSFVDLASEMNSLRYEGTEP